MQTQSSLGDQCIQSEGLAQVKVELKQVAGYNRINIIDVLRHPDESTEDGTDFLFDNAAGYFCGAFVLVYFILCR